MIIYNDKFVNHFADSITDTVMTKDEDSFVRYFEGHIEKLKEEFLKDRPLDEWNLLINSKELRRFRLHNFTPTLYVMCKFKLLEHVTYVRNTYMFFDFTYRTIDGKPLCAIKDCNHEPIALINKVTKEKGVLIILMLCAFHEAGVHSDSKKMNYLLDQRIKQHIELEPEEASKYFPEYVEHTVYDY